MQGQGQIKGQRQGFRIFRHRLRGVNSNSWSRGLTINLLTYNTDVDCDHHRYRCFGRWSSVQPLFPSSPICLSLTHAANAGGQRTIRETGAQLWNCRTLSTRYLVPPPPRCYATAHCILHLSLAPILSAHNTLNEIHRARLSIPVLYTPRAVNIGALFPPPVPGASTDYGRRRISLSNPVPTPATRHCRGRGRAV